ncbi:MAG TPA: hypothetical protein VLM38_24580 [Blastocatellia bacterium]|nr:hypothetical protein [Blastocatellia bacterium]
MKVTLPHIRFEEMVDLVEGRLGGDELLQARAHLDRCEGCAAQRTRLEDTIKMMREDASEDAPRQAIAGALSSFRSRARGEASALRRLVAALTFDSLQAVPAMGMRAAAGAGRQLVFSAGESQLHLQVKPDAEGWVLCGQVLGECAGGTVELSNASAAVRVALNPMCEFELPAMAEGAYKLLLRLGDIEMEIPELNLGA